MALNPINLTTIQKQKQQNKNNMEYIILNKGPSINYITDFIRIYNQVLLPITFPVLFSLNNIFAKILLQQTRQTFLIQFIFAKIHFSIILSGTSLVTLEKFNSRKSHY